jgi:hypothetical protein
MIALVAFKVLPSIFSRIWGGRLDALDVVPGPVGQLGAAGGVVAVANPRKAQELGRWMVLR